MFNTILLAVDPSKAPEKAYHYARGLTSQLGGKLQLIYVFHPKQLKGWLRSSKKPEDLKTYFENRLQLLNPKKNGDASLSKADLIPQKVIEGFPEEELLHLIHEEEIELILLNIDAFSYPFNENFGKVVSTISTDSACPVLLLPPNILFTGFEKILFVVDWEYLQHHQLEYMTGLAYLFNAEIHLLYVSEQERSEGLEKSVLVHLENLAPGLRFSYQWAAPQMILKGINDYLRQENIQLVNFISSNRHFWANFLKTHLNSRYQLLKDLPILINYFD